MLSNPICPTCTSRSWEVVGVHRYAQSESDISEYVALRRRVLFEVWFREHDPVLELRSAMCSKCGFMTYVPRPSVEDLEAKYRFLAQHEPPKVAPKPDTKRAVRVGREILDVCPSPRSALDFGGGNGILLSSLECEKYLIDYATNVLPGITKLGDTLEDIPAGMTFDVVVCSHVLEHLADPSEIVFKLARVIAPGGILYAEVPLQLGADIPIREDPVTHVNFFNRHNLLAICQSGGLGAIAIKEKLTTFFNGAIDAIIVISKKGSAPIPVDLNDGVAYTRQMLQQRETVLRDIRRRLRHRQYPTLAGAKRRLLTIPRRLAGITAQGF